MTARRIGLLLARPAVILAGFAAVGTLTGCTDTPAPALSTYTQTRADGATATCIDQADTVSGWQCSRYRLDDGHGNTTLRIIF